MRHIPFASRSVSLGSYYFSKVRFAGRIRRVCPAETEPNR